MYKYLKLMKCTCNFSQLKNKAEIPLAPMGVLAPGSAHGANEHSNINKHVDMNGSSTFEPTQAGA